MIHLRRLVLALALLAGGALLSQCGSVKPWERGSLADATMSPDLDPVGGKLLDHIYFSREAASGGRGVGGGGCGCN